MSVKVEMKHLLGRCPLLFFSVYRMLAPQHHITECLLSPEKEIVIEGFPRSANTFAVVAFRQAQGRNVPMAHHLHVEAQIIRGARMGKPVIALMRHPVDAVKSLMIRHPGATPDWAFRRYIQFYEGVAKVKERVVVAQFDEVTNDFGTVIRRVNERFGTHYRPFVHSEENVARVYSEIQEINKQFDEGKETHVARPSREREAVKQQLSFDEGAPMVVRALDIYTALTR